MDENEATSPKIHDKPLGFGVPYFPTNQKMWLVDACTSQVSPRPAKLFNLLNY
jgi:hypothetical protein